MNNNTNKMSGSPMKRGPMGHGRAAVGEKANNFKGTMIELIKYISKYKISLVAVFLFAIGSTIFSITGPKILGKATTKIFEGLVKKVSGSGGIDFQSIEKLLLILVGLYLISAIFSFIQGYLMSGISQKISYEMRNQISEKINRMPMKYFDTKTHGEILSRITNDVDTLGMSLNQSITQLITSITTMVGIVIMMFSISWIMTLAILVIIPLSVFAVRKVVGKSQKYFKNQQVFLGNLNGIVEENYGGHQIVKVFNKEKESIEEFNKVNDKLYDSSWKAQFLSGIMQPLMAFIGNLGYVMVSILGGWLVIKKAIEVGDIQSFIQYVKNFTQPITQLAQVANQLQSTAAASERVFEFLAEEEEDQTVINPVNINNIEGNIEFEHVNFGYKENKTIINDFSINVKKGQKIAIVGPTGAGKTTIIKLLMRFYDVNSGSIKIDGHDIRNFNRSELRELFGMVLQDTWLFNASIRENIKFGKLSATDDEIISAAKSANVHHFIKTLNDGYDMVLDEEASNVSQGQKQLLTIARAILADPKILILDEATSSVDTRTELLIQKAMDRLMEGRTSFVIAHRLSTIKDADIILVMNEGDIVEHGNHEELLKKGGFYSKLYNSQFEEDN
ncbi:ABC transporter ATP-binding protein [Peptacetobacter sp.]|uniref:ABC transporter ATP-binding protein n=1 Tax=Peptacetobacter sp. TaxID=2991975 RepID=UPI002ED66B0B